MCDEAPRRSPSADPGCAPPLVPVLVGALCVIAALIAGYYWSMARRRRARRTGKASAASQAKTRPRRVTFVNVFVNNRGEGGNKLAVVCDADGMCSSEMQRVAAAMALPETTFVMAPSVPGADYRVRVFSPSREVPFAGHPLVGTAAVVVDAGVVVPSAGGRLAQQVRGSALIGSRGPYYFIALIGFIKINGGIFGAIPRSHHFIVHIAFRSEERRVGKECC